MRKSTFCILAFGILTIAGGIASWTMRNHPDHKVLTYATLACLALLATAFIARADSSPNIPKFKKS